MQHQYSLSIIMVSIIVTPLENYRFVLSRPLQCIKPPPDHAHRATQASTALYWELILTSGKYRTSASMEFPSFLKGWELVTPGCQQWLVPRSVCVCGGEVGGGEGRNAGIWRREVFGFLRRQCVCLSLDRGCRG